MTNYERIFEEAIGNYGLISSAQAVRAAKGPIFTENLSLRCVDSVQPIPPVFSLPCPAG